MRKKGKKAGVTSLRKQMRKGEAWTSPERGQDQGRYRPAPGGGVRLGADNRMWMMEQGSGSWLKAPGSCVTSGKSFAFSVPSRFF